MLGRAVAKEEVEDILEKLPDQYRELWGGEPKDALSPTAISPEYENRECSGQA